MPKRVLSILAVLLIASVLMTGLSLAQTDSDGDTVEDSQDRCPLTPGTPRYGGCPESVSYTHLDVYKRQL